MRISDGSSDVCSSDLGIVFGFGLSLSGMLNPARVQGFLDVFGAWDPSLAFVLGGAVVVAFIGVQVMKRMRHPAFDDSFHVPPSRRIDAPLIIGSALFGLGWGIDRKSVVSGKSVSVRVDLGGRRIFKQQNKYN